MNYEQKYLKYKNKYLNLKTQLGFGNMFSKPVAKPLAFKSPEKKRPIAQLIMICDHCKNEITSQIHRDSCNTVSMHGIKESIISVEFKPMMTYGLGGCTAILMVFFRKGTNECYKVVLGHTPIKENIIKWYNRYYTDIYNIVTIIKTPLKYEKEGENWIEKVSNQEYWVSNIRKINCRLILEPYSTTEEEEEEEEEGKSPFRFRSSLYFKMSPGPKYSDLNGTYIDIIPSAASAEELAEAATAAVALAAEEARAASTAKISTSTGLSTGEIIPLADGRLKCNICDAISGTEISAMTHRFGCKYK